MILKGKVAWITGALGTIGGAIAERFLNEGAHIYSTRIDILDYASVIKAADLIQPDILVNCAGVYGPQTSIECGVLVDWVNTINVNLIGSHYLTRAVLPHMIKKGEGKIIHMSGGGAANGRAFYSAYASSKAGLVRMVECVAYELNLIPAKIHINAIAPGSVKSKMNPEGTGTPDKAVELALFLASQESNHLTGRLISAIHDDWTKLVSTEAGKLRRTPWTE